jgi:hypothetical protein
MRSGSFRSGRWADGEAAREIEEGLDADAKANDGGTALKRAVRQRFGNPIGVLNGLHQVDRAKVWVSAVAQFSGWDFAPSWRPDGPYE